MPQRDKQAESKLPLINLSGNFWKNIAPVSDGDIICTVGGDNVYLYTSRRQQKASGELATNKKNIAYALIKTMPNNTKYAVLQTHNRSNSALMAAQVYLPYVDYNVNFVTSKAVYRIYIVTLIDSRFGSANQILAQLLVSCVYPLAYIGLLDMAQTPKLCATCFARDNCVMNVTTIDVFGTIKKMHQYFSMCITASRSEATIRTILQRLYCTDLLQDNIIMYLDFDYDPFILQNLDRFFSHLTINDNPYYKFIKRKPKTVPLNFSIN